MSPSRMYCRIKSQFKRITLLCHKWVRGKRAQEGLAQVKPVTSVQWQLDCPYAEKPQYKNTVVYIDLNSSLSEREPTQEIQKEERVIKITHYPPTHRLH